MIREETDRALEDIEDSLEHREGQHRIRVGDTPSAEDHRPLGYDRHLQIIHICEFDDHRQAGDFRLRDQEDRLRAEPLREEHHRLGGHLHLHLREQEGQRHLRRADAPL